MIKLLRLSKSRHVMAGEKFVSTSHVLDAIKHSQSLNHYIPNHRIDDALIRTFLPNLGILTGKMKIILLSLFKFTF